MGRTRHAWSMRMVRHPIATLARLLAALSLVAAMVFAFLPHRHDTNAADRDAHAHCLACVAQKIFSTSDTTPAPIAQPLTISRAEFRPFIKAVSVAPAFGPLRCRGPPSA